MKRVAGILLVLFGVGLVLLGLMFLITGGKASRYLTAVAGLGLGGVAVGVGVRLYKKADASSPAQIRAELLALAGRHNGELSEADVAGGLGRRATLAEAELSAMVQQGLCRREDKGGAAYYVFEEMQPRLMVRRCEFCKAELPLQEQVSECPNCGGTIETRVERRSLSEDDYYGMDE